MDYLLRDTEFTGVTYGKFDLDKVIEGLVVSVDSMGRYRICFMEKYRSYIEEYFYARYQMYNNVYYHPYKLLSEEIFCKILQEAKKLTLNGSLVSNMLSPALELIFTQSEVSVDMYCQLDDTVAIGAIQTWSGLEQQPLAYLSASLLERRGYCRLEVVDVDRFIDKAKDIFGDSVLEKHFLICLDKMVNMYDKSKGIYILNNSGIIKRLQECSALAGEYSSEKYIYYSKELAKDIYDIDEEKLEEFEELIKRCMLSNNMEIEKKYVFPKENYQEIMDSLKNYLLGRNYQIHDMSRKLQVDTYYDTPDNYLNNNDHTLRFREVGDDVYITCKHPVSSSLSHGLGGQLERKEEEERANGSDLDANQEIISRFLSNLSNRMNLLKDMEKKVEIKNKRNKFMVYKNIDVDNEFLETYEIAFDDVKYMNLSNNKSYNECQLEIELKSSYQNRINMKHLTDGLEKNMMQLKPIAESKYKRALRYTK